MLPIWAVEECNNREEVVNKDWIEKCYYEQKYDCKTPYLVSINEFRSDMEKHCPATKKFTHDDIGEFYDNYQ